MKSITLAGKRYKLTNLPMYDRIELSGHGVLAYLPVGITTDSPDLREQAAAALECERENRRAASEMIQQRVRDGTAGIGGRS